MTCTTFKEDISVSKGFDSFHFVRCGPRLKKMDARHFQLLAASTIQALAVSKKMTSADVNFKRRCYKPYCVEDILGLGREAKI